MKLKRVCLTLAAMVVAGTLAYADGITELERLTRGQRVDSGTPARALRVDDGSIRLTPDKTHILRLEQDASSVIVTNPAHASIMLDSPRLLVIMPRNPGTTSFTVLNSKGEVVLEKKVIITTGAENNYVRVRKMCGPSDVNCVPTAYYYCPDGCYEVETVPPSNETDIPEIASTAPPPEPETAPPQQNDENTSPDTEEENGEPIAPEQSSTPPSEPEGTQ